MLIERELACSRVHKERGKCLLLHAYNMVLRKDLYIIPCFTYYLLNRYTSVHGIANISQGPIAVYQKNPKNNSEVKTFLFLIKP